MVYPIMGRTVMGCKVMRGQQGSRPEWRHAGTGLRRSRAQFSISFLLVARSPAFIPSIMAVNRKPRSNPIFGSMPNRSSMPAWQDPRDMLQRSSGQQRSSMCHTMCSR